ncbi:MAG: PspC domain-containing protein [Candidatus Cloacimonetes bacterium]|nr:PspC domain-containing protein [Candidatus Cloacimonadota bacterium]
MKRIYKNRQEGKLFGVCAGFGEFLNIDPVLVRILTIGLTFLSAGCVIFIYIIAALIMPDKKEIFRAEIVNDEGDR